MRDRFDGEPTHTYPICHDTRDCFAKVKCNGRVKCCILMETYEGNACKFRKKEEPQCGNTTAQTAEQTAD